jgi:hypothetical protein
MCFFQSGYEREYRETFMGFEIMHMIDVFFEMRLVKNLPLLSSVGECLVMYFRWKTGHSGGNVNKPSLFVLRRDN